MKNAECNICKTKDSKYWVMCLGGWTLCQNCSKDYSDFKLQVEKGNNIVIMMEVYFRRGKGEKISYEQLHKEKSDYKFLTFKELFELKKRGGENAKGG